VLTSATPTLVAGVHLGALGVQRLSPVSDIGATLGPLRVCDLDVDEEQFVYLAPAAQLQTVLDTWRVLTAAYLIGAGDCVLARTVAYVADRHQFGRPIGAYQVVQHGLADLPGMLSGARLPVGKAAWSVDQPDQPPANDLARNDINDGRVLASMALLFAVDAANAVVDRAIHYHGAMGAAAETGIHSFYRMVCSLPLLLGPINTQRRLLADLLLEPTWTSP
jgi:alkylation response protein AidB-like acyl-CoA dehydrogenase